MNTKILVRSSLLAVLMQAATMSPSLAATSSSSAELTGIAFVFDNAKSYIDESSVSQVSSLTYDFDQRPTTVLSQQQAPSFAAGLNQSISSANYGATLLSKPGTVASSLQVSAWPAGDVLPVASGNAQFMRASVNVMGNLYLAPLSSVDMNVGYRLSGSNSFTASDTNLAAAAAGVSANFSTADMAFVPTTLDVYAQTTPSQPFLFDDRHTVSFANSLNEWVKVGFSLAAVSDSRGFMPSPVPEVSTWAMLLAGLAGLMVLKRHQLRRRS